MINLELTPKLEKAREGVRALSVGVFRPASREWDTKGYHRWRRYKDLLF